MVVPRGVPGAWTLAFADDFSGSSLDSRRWSAGWFSAGISGPVNAAEDGCYDPAQVQFRGDATLSIELIKKTNTCGGKVRSWTTGLVTTNGKYHYTYGASEARMYLPPGADGQPLNWPAFWANGQNWPTDGENDVMESMGGATGPHFHSRLGAPGFVVPGVWGGWHTFGSVWEPGLVTYYYDGRRVGSISQGITGAPMYLILGFAPATDGSTRPARLRVDYVRVWQH